MEERKKMYSELSDEEFEKLTVDEISALMIEEGKANWNALSPEEKWAKTLKIITESGEPTSPEKMELWRKEAFGEITNEELHKGLNACNKKEVAEERAAEVAEVCQQLDQNIKDYYATKKGLIEEN